jgi:signal transduction histidine kinase
MAAGSRTTHNESDRNMPVVRASAKRAPRVPNGGADDRARELMTMAAHDLRSPLAAIKMRATAIEQRWRTGEPPTGAEWAAVVSRISRLVDNACSLIDDLLAIERLDYPFRPTATRRPVDVEKLVHEAIVYQRNLDGPRNNVAVFVHRQVDRARGMWDRVYLLRVLSNLLANAFKHAPGAPIHITLGRRGKRLAIVFADRGPGLSADGDGAGADGGRASRGIRAETAGPGLGLWIVRRAVERLDGRLRIRNAPGRGVAFDIELPGLQV